MKAFVITTALCVVFFVLLVTCPIVCAYVPSTQQSAPQPPVQAPAGVPSEDLDLSLLDGTCGLREVDGVRCVVCVSGNGAGYGHGIALDCYWQAPVPAPVVPSSRKKQ